MTDADLARWETTLLELKSRRLTAMVDEGLLLIAEVRRLRAEHALIALLPDAAILERVRGSQQFKEWTDPKN